MTQTNKLCTKCWQQNCSCNYLTVEIDESISEIISILNLKGYKTLYCCGGHINRLEIEKGLLPNIYIYFDKNINVNPDEIGFGWMYKNNVLRKTFLYVDIMSDKSLEYMMEKERIKLFVWANNLQKLQKNY